ncbi:hypothetical protein I307_00737 [Cryptococcus deuterogattii 99/473]|uniref:Uncharacterized protein n=1 Tax=Cryptococcus deuterogattii Ram5 TaxID=1296110 RepID=A0A0D0VBR6_9TREE|nr:hypothetical protein I313_01482 [Cryptococcus deuterogattii Ram5]KIR72915.1 hypothetical protein I310_03519 [Cryptococcus deuterogattii CA1014]KIY59665.1 hypothetical protein I307_00737 [Cryptococcus deuterogattii 99/473]
MPSAWLFRNMCNYPVTMSSSSNSVGRRIDGPPSDGTEAMQRASRLAALKYIQGDLPEQVTAYYLRDHYLQKTLSVISQAPVSIPSFSERVRTLNFMDSESVIQTLGYKRGEPKLTDYRNWDSSRVSQYSKTLQEQAELLCRGREYVQDILEGSGTDRLQVLLEDMNTHLEETKKHKNVKWSDATCTHLDVIRRSYNVVQSHLTVNQMLPDIATKMYNDLCSLHSGASEPLTGKNKTRSRPWTDALSELRFAVSNLQSSAWNTDPDLLIDIEHKADGFFTESTERQEGPIREGHMAALTKRHLDDPTYGPPPQRFRLTRELENYMEAKRAEVIQMMANVDRDWKDISGANFKWSEVTTPAISRQSESLFVSDPVNKVKVLTFLSIHQDHLLECTIPSIPSKVDYTPDLSALKPIPQVAFNCLSALQQDIDSYAETLLSKQPRSKMIPSQKVKYDTAISSAMEEIVERSRTKWEEMTGQLNDSTVVPEELEAHSALISRAVSNYFTLRALLTRHNGPPATNKKERRASATSVQKDREEAKKWEKNVEEWHASRRTSESIDVSNDDQTSQQPNKSGGSDSLREWLGASR